jgi:hypothetical protein
MEMLQTLKEIAAIPGLSTAFSIAVSITVAVEGAKTNKKLLISLNNRVVSLILGINQSNACLELDSVQRLELFLRELLHWIGKQQEKNVLKQMVQQQNIKEKIRQWEVEFQSFVQLFQVELALTQQWQPGYLEQSFGSDLDDIKSLLLTQHQSIDSLISQLGVFHHQYVDAMARIEQLQNQPQLFLGELDSRVEHVVSEELKSIFIALKQKSNVTLESSNNGGLQIGVDDVELESDIPFSSGSFGEVFHGHWQGRKVVVKRAIVRNLHHMKQVYSDFKKEMKVWSQLNHPNVVTLLVFLVD